MKKLVLVFSLLFALFIGASTIALVKIRSYVNNPILIEKTTLISVPDGANFQSMVRKLVSENIIDQSMWSKFVGRLFPELSKLKAGTYQVKPNVSLYELFSILGSGKEHQFSITFVEGTTFKQWKEQLKNTQYLSHHIETMSEEQISQKLGLDKSKLEGLFLPETYHYVAGESDLTILKRAATALTQTLEEAWLSRSSNLPIKNSYDLLTLASIIEKETGLSDERGKVSSVFVNRLNKRMRLQTDPTVIYGMGDSYTGNIRKKDLQTPTPYNTYVIYGLPPTPIAMAGKASIFAAAKPEKTPFYYFVAKGNGGHQFSKTLAEHNRAVAAYLEYLKSQK